MGRKALSRFEKINALKKRYGDGIINDMERCRDLYGVSLNDVAQKYGFTREYARQIYPVIFGREYTYTKTKKKFITKSIKQCDINMKHDVRYKAAEYSGLPGQGAKIELVFYNECLKRNLNIKNSLKNHIDIIVNGFSVDVKSASKAFKASPEYHTAYFRYKLSELQYKELDFVACYHPSCGSFFIIPRNNFPVGRMIYIAEYTSDYQTSKNTFYEFKDAWHFIDLKQKVAA